MDSQQIFATDRLREIFGRVPKSLAKLLLQRTIRAAVFVSVERVQPFEPEQSNVVMSVVNDPGYDRVV